MNINGYAFEPNSEEIIEEKNKRLEEIEHLKSELDFKRTPDYKRTNFKGAINEDCEEAMNLSAKDIFLLVTDGHIPFGGFCDIRGNTFSGAKYTD